MAGTARHNKLLMEKYEKQKHDPKCSPLEKLRAQCLSRGANGIKGLGRTFKIMDDDQSRSLDKAEFKKGLRDYKVDLDKETTDQLFDSLDVDHSGTLDFDEFLIALRPPMNNGRKQLVFKAFTKLDKTKDNVITIEDLKGVYNVTKHPKYLSGEWDEDKCLGEFLVSFDSKDNADGQVTEEEFMNYYSGVSASIDNDAYFDLMMRNAWKI